MRNTLLSLAFSLVVLACSNGGGVITSGGDTTDIQRSSTDQQGPELDVAPVPDSPDVPISWDGSEAKPEDAFISCEGSGCPGDPCQTNQDCKSGICTRHLGDFVCSDFCVEECPEGFSCKPWGEGPDGTYVCLSLHSHLCLPCADATDCSELGQQNVCAVYPEYGTFCGALCEANQLCPDGYGCQEVLSTESTVTKQCVRLDGECKCTQNAIELALSTPCVTKSDFGACTGMRVCTEEGLSQCDAKIPAEDVCNGLDDNCDGVTDEAACDDGNECTDDSCDPLQGCLQQPLSGDLCNDGNKCTTGDSCSAGICAGTEVQCNDGNPCTDDLCDELTGCTFPNNTTPCDDGDPCTLGDHCQDSACVSGPAITCNDGNACTEDICDAAAGCLYESLTGACDDENPCTTGDHCDKGSCAWSDLLDCDDGNLCTADACDPGLGCVHEANALPCDDSSLCTLGDKCSAGSCAPGKALACDDGNACTDDICNPLVGCIHTNNSLQCEDLDPCTTTDICSSGTCVGTGLVDCDDGNPCTDDFCSPMAGCSHQANTAPCDDSDLCTVGDKCNASLCAPGAPLPCDDNNPCTQDLCQANDGCAFVAINAPCDDGNQCTSDDHCSAGKCTSDQAVECDDGNPCTTDLCLPGGGCTFVPNAAPCDDGDLCTSGDVCQLAECQPGAPVECDDGNLCTADACLDGKCLHTPTDLVCDDQNACTVGDKCSEGACKGFFALKCDDDNLCTSDYCDPGQGCTYVLNSSPCDDGNVCTFGDHCDGGDCVTTDLLVCNDGNPCTTDLCDPQKGCTFSPTDGGCDDGNECTSGDHCLNGLCAFTSFNACDDENVCTADSCDVLLGCLHGPQAGLCDDNDACTTADACANGFCSGGPAPDCDDGEACTDDSCTADTGCLHAPVQNGGGCDDLDACTPTDQCTDGACVGSGSLVCVDNDACTTDSCDAAQGCVYTPISPCCGNGQKEAGEGCDDGNTVGGDGCSATCQSETACPADTAFINGYCWVKAIAHKESHGAACSRVGKAATPKEVAMTWNNTVLKQVAATWGYTSIGDFQNSAHAMWCYNGAKHCGTHNWGSPFDNYGPYGDGNYWPVYTCKP